MSITEEGGGRFVVESSPSQSTMWQRKPFSLLRDTSVEIGFGKTLGHSDPASTLGDSLGGRVRGVPLDGKTAYERLKGKRAKTLGIEFGEGVHWRMKQAKGALGKSDSLWSDGVFLRIKGKTGEIIVGDAEGTAEPDWCGEFTQISDPHSSCRGKLVCEVNDESESKHPLLCANTKIRTPSRRDSSER